jgi:mevalonate kinase
MGIGHGKIILFGEHAVVHGVPAVAVAVEGGAVVQATPAAGVTTLAIAPWNLTVDTGAVEHPSAPLVQQALKVARGFYADDLELTLAATMHLPAGAGMGSSAALGVAVLRAMDDARGLSRGQGELVDRAYEWEKVFHGTPGGIDNTMAVYGGVGLYAKGSGFKPVRLGAPLRFLVGDSGEQRVGGKMIAIVRDKLARDPEFGKRWLAAIAAIVDNGKLALELGNARDLGQLMNMNHMELASVMVVTAELETMCQAARKAGALGAKMTGAGGGGCMIALVEADTKASVRSALQGLGKQVYEVEIAP